MKNRTNKGLPHIIKGTINRWEMWDEKLNVSGIYLIGFSISSLTIPAINIGSAIIPSPYLRLWFLILSFYVSFILHENFSKRMRLNFKIIQDSQCARVVEYLERRKKFNRNCQAYNAGCFVFGIIFFYTLSLT